MQAGADPAQPRISASATLPAPARPPPSMPCITDEASPFALRSTRNRPRRAMRRGAAWPAERPSSRRCARAQHGWAPQRAVARRGGQGSPDAGCAVVTVSAFVSGIRCPVSSASVRCPRGACPRDRVSGAGVRASRCPVSGVRALRRPRCPTAMRSRGVAVEPAAARLGWPESAWSPAMSVTARRLPEVGAWPRSRGRPCWASGGHRVRVWAWVGWPLSASGLHCGLSLRPQRGRNLQ